jgi:hypothetical protein
LVSFPRAAEDLQDEICGQNVSGASGCCPCTSKPGDATLGPEVTGGWPGVSCLLVVDTGVTGSRPSPHEIREVDFQVVPFFAMFGKGGKDVSDSFFHFDIFFLLFSSISSLQLILFLCQLDNLSDFVIRVKNKNCLLRLPTIGLFIRAKNNYFWHSQLETERHIKHANRQQTTNYNPLEVNAHLL